MTREVPAILPDLDVQRPPPLIKIHAQILDRRDERPKGTSDSVKMLWVLSAQAMEVRPNRLPQRPDVVDLSGGTCGPHGNPRVKVVHSPCLELISTRLDTGILGATEPSVR